MAQLVARLREPQSGDALRWKRKIASEIGRNSDFVNAGENEKIEAINLGVMAQLVARLNGIQEVTSSNLVSSTKSK